MCLPFDTTDTSAIIHLFVSVVTDSCYELQERGLINALYDSIRDFKISLLLVTTEVLLVKSANTRAEAHLDIRGRVFLEPRAKCFL